MDLLKHTLQPSQSLPLTTLSFCMKMRTFHGPFGDMWFHFRNDWPLRMWPSNSLRRSGNSWTLLRGPCTGLWCWRPTGTCFLWVRMTSFQSCPWYLHFPCVPLGRTWCLSSESSGDSGMIQLHKVKLTFFRCCVCLLSHLRLSQSLIIYKAHWQMLKEHTKIPLTFGSVFRKMHSTLDLFLLITLNIHFFLFCLFVYFYWLHHSACGSLFPWPRIKPVPPALEVQSLKHRIHQGSIRIYISDLNIISTLEQEEKLWTVGSDVKIAKDTMYKQKVSQKGCFFLFWSGTCWWIGSSVFVT